MQKFELILKNEKQKLYRRLTVFVLLFNTAAISWFLFSYPPSIAEKITGISALLLLLVTLSIYPGGKDKGKDPLFWLTASLIFCYWLIAGHGWMALFVACLFVLHFINRRKLSVRFYPDKIKYPSFPERTIRWDELSNVILKDDWLTLDFKNNRIIQQFTEESIPAGNEKEFNDFCRQLLNK